MCMGEVGRFNYFPFFRFDRVQSSVQWGQLAKCPHKAYGFKMLASYVS